MDIVCHSVTQYCFHKHTLCWRLKRRDGKFWSLFCCLVLLSHQCLDFRETIMASAGRSRILLVLKILVLGFQASTSTRSVFTGWKLNTVPLEVKRNKHCGMAVLWTLVYCDIWLCLLRKWSSVFFIKNKVILCSFSCRRDQVYSRAGAVRVRTTTSPCRGMQVYKQLQRRFARSEGFREGKAAWV